MRGFLLSHVLLASNDSHVALLLELIRVGDACSKLPFAHRTGGYKVPGEM